MNAPIGLDLKFIVKANQEEDICAEGDRHVE